MDSDEKNIIIVTMLMVVATIGLFTAGGIIDHIEREKYNQFVDTQGIVTKATRGDYLCFSQKNCNDCTNGSQYDFCSNMLENGTIGYCNQNISKCCVQHCFNCNDKICTDCGAKGPHCTNNCYCKQPNHSPLCTIIDGTCYEPTINISFKTNDGTVVSTSLTKQCGMGNIGCTNSLQNCHIDSIYTTCSKINIGEMKVNKTIDIVYDVNEPTKFIISKKCEYITPVNTTTLYLLGVIPAVFTAIIICISIYVIISACYTYEKYRTRHNREELERFAKRVQIQRRYARKMQKKQERIIQRNSEIEKEYIEMQYNQHINQSVNKDNSIKVGTSDDDILPSYDTVIAI